MMVEDTRDLAGPGTADEHKRVTLAEDTHNPSGPGTAGELKQEVRQFYDRVGWSLVGDDLYQNAHYEDLRPVSSEYIQRCHRRVGRHLRPRGRFLLDAGSGPIQYPQYLEYSRGYEARVCADISITALKEARRRIGDIAASDGRGQRGHGMFVVADIANLPFKEGAFDGVVTLHTIHHLPEAEHLQAYQELYRVLNTCSRAVVVNGWPSSRLMNAAEPLIRLNRRLRSLAGRLQGRQSAARSKPGRQDSQLAGDPPGPQDGASPKGTFTSRHDVAWVKQEVGGQIELEILVWRSVSVRFLRNFIQPWAGGKYWLRLLYWLEERFPHYFGENGQYPLIVLRKT